MKNICFIIPNLAGGGAEKVVLNLATKLTNLGHRVDIILLYDRIEHNINNVNVNIHYLRKKQKISDSLSPLFVRTSAKLLLAKLEHINITFDLFVSHLPPADRIAIFAKLNPLYCCLHRNVSAELNNQFLSNTLWKIMIYKTMLMIGFPNNKRIEAKLYAKQKILTVSQGIQDDFLTLNVQPKSIQTIYNPFDFNFIAQQANAYQVKENNYIIHLGRISFKDKRHDILIKAYAKSGIKEKLLLFGNIHDVAYFKKLQQLITKLRLEKKVIFKGFSPNPYPYIKQAKVLVLSSDFEGLSTVLIEALILKTMVVSTDCPSGPNEVLTGELANFLSPIGDIDALANNIKNALNNPVDINNEYVAKFSDDIIAKQYLSLIQA